MNANGPNPPANIQSDMKQLLQHLESQGYAVDHLKQMQLPQHQLQPPPGQAAPAMFWYPWQVQGIAGASATGQPWVPFPMQPAMPQTSLAELVTAAVTNAMRPLQEKEASAVGSVLNDEQVLLDALRRAKAERLSPRQALEKLDNVNNHSEASWKNYFLDHLERLYPKIYRRAESHDSSGPSSRGRAPDHPRREPPMIEIPRYKVPKATQSTSTNNRPQIPRYNTAMSASAGPRIIVSTKQTMTSQRLEPEDRRRVSSSGENTSVRRSRRGGPADEYHAETLIPPSDSSCRPKPPHRLSSEQTSTFADADKIFFIHYLRWRVRQSPLIEKSELHSELALEMPHHDADSWRRHWLQHCELPDRILAQAAKEAKVDESSDSEEELDERNEEVEDTPNVIARRFKLRRNAQRVTEEDLRAMAQYKVENLELWDDFSSRAAAWTKFATRPENKTKRSVGAWACAASDHDLKLKGYVREYLDQRTPGSQAPSPSRGASSSSSCNAMDKRQIDSSTTIELSSSSSDERSSSQDRALIPTPASLPGKRRAEDQGHSDSPTSKRVKKEEINDVIEIL